MTDRPDWDDKNLAQKGFTLIELLVVILILGVLAAVVVIAVANLTDNAKDNSCKTEVRQIRTAIQAYRVDWNDPDANPPLAALENEYLDGESEYATAIADYDATPIVVTTDPPNCDTP